MATGTVSSTVIFKYGSVALAKLLRDMGQQTAGVLTYLVRLLQVVRVLLLMGRLLFRGTQDFIWP
jgi:hypothetical protein